MFPQDQGILEGGGGFCSAPSMQIVLSWLFFFFVYQLTKRHLCLLMTLKILSLSSWICLGSSNNSGPVKVKLFFSFSDFLSA